MIEEYPFMLDLGRPTFYKDEHFEFWAKVFNFIETCGIDLKKNGIYSDMKNYCDKRQNYHGGGFKFCFWFRTHVDKERFQDGIDEINGYRTVILRGMNLIRTKQYYWDHYGFAYAPKFTGLWIQEPVCRH